MSKMAKRGINHGIFADYSIVTVSYSGDFSLLYFLNLVLGVGLMFLKCLRIDGCEVTSHEVWLNTEHILFLLTDDVKTEEQNIKDVNGNLYRVSKPVIIKDLRQTVY